MPILTPDQKSKAAQGIRRFRAYLRVLAAADAVAAATYVLGESDPTARARLACADADLSETAASMYAAPRPEGVAVDKGGETWFLVHADTDAPVFEGTLVERHGKEFSVLGGEPPTKFVDGYSGGRVYVQRVGSATTKNETMFPNLVGLRWARVQEEE